MPPDGPIYGGGNRSGDDLNQLKVVRAMTPIAMYTESGRLTAGQTLRPVTDIPFKPTLEA